MGGRGGGRREHLLPHPHPETWVAGKSHSHCAHSRGGAHLAVDLDRLSASGWSVTLTVSLQSGWAGEEGCERPRPGWVPALRPHVGWRASLAGPGRLPAAFVYPARGERQSS